MPSWEWVRLASKEAVLLAIQNSQKFRLEAFNTSIDNCITPKKKHVSAHHKKSLFQLFHLATASLSMQCPILLHKPG